MSDLGASQEQQRQYLSQWRSVGPVLDGIRFQELRAMTDEERVRSTAALMACSIRRIPNDATGWVAWQKVRDRWMNRG